MGERWRDLAGPVGLLEPGPLNTVADVPGVLVGNTQAVSGERTGVTVVAPPALPAAAGAATINGMGELTGMLEVQERGSIITPVYLCGTHAVGTVHRAAMLAAGGGRGNVVLPTVGECDDTDMGDSRTVTEDDVRRALDDLDADVPEGSVGAGTGMTCFGFPGGIGTASRSVGDHRVGVLLLCNFGDRERLDVLEPLGTAAATSGPQGSCIAICATDAPMTPNQLRRLALRPLLGLARTGSYAADGSGEIGLAFTTSTDRAIADGELNGYFAAGFEAASEAVYNCLVAARPAKRLDGSVQDAFPIDSVRSARPLGDR